MRDLPVQHVNINTDWRRRGACVAPKDHPNPKAHTDLWFPEKNGDQTYPKFVCKTRCPVRDECLNYALVTKPGFGIWGGLSENERIKIRRRTTFAYIRRCKNSSCSNDIHVYTNRSNAPEFCSARCMKAFGRAKFYPAAADDSDDGYWDWVRGGRSNRWSA